MTQGLSAAAAAAAARNEKPAAQCTWGYDSCKYHIAGILVIEACWSCNIDLSAYSLVKMLTTVCKRDEQLHNKGRPRSSHVDDCLHMCVRHAYKTHKPGLGIKLSSCCTVSSRTSCSIQHDHLHTSQTRTTYTRCNTIMQCCRASQLLRCRVVLHAARQHALTESWLSAAAAAPAAPFVSGKKPGYLVGLLEA